MQKAPRRAGHGGAINAQSIWADSQRIDNINELVLVAGAGSNHYLRPEQVKVVAGTGVDHNLQSTPAKMVAGACNHLNLQLSQATMIAGSGQETVTVRGRYLTAYLVQTIRSLRETIPQASLLKVSA
ncbi:hypothetical protein D2T29_21980 [Sinirhodobacter populi]|uniref:Uncharacterized protein n=2 Tax=Paenirhodobacter populi TaxID=2306993 RepID=A0A443JYE5_9RHOB|nr:hypothetical protein D2T29_21980 [Sinirhodobacter populi]